MNSVGKVQRLQVDLHHSPAQVAGYLFGHFALAMVAETIENTYGSALIGCTLAGVCVILQSSPLFSALTLIYGADFMVLLPHRCSTT